jgi:toxin-antitoxin system, antitoxin component, xre family
MLRRRSPHWKRFALASALRFRSFFAEGEMIELTPDLKPLIEQWVTLTPSQKQAVLIMVKEMNNLKA